MIDNVVLDEFSRFHGGLWNKLLVDSKRFFFFLLFSFEFALAMEYSNVILFIILMVKVEENEQQK